MNLTKNVFDTLQNEIRIWQDTIFPQADQSALLRYFEYRHKELDSSVASKDAADCFMLLFHYANSGGYSLWDEINIVQSPCNSFLTWELLRQLRDAFVTFKEQQNATTVARYAQLVLRLCIVKHYDMEHDIRSNFTSIKDQDWSTHNTDGIVRHVKNSHRENEQISLGI